MEIAASVSISRDSHDTIRIRVRDENAVMEFLTVEMTPHDFAMAITGLSEIKCHASVRGLENVGKTRVREERSVICQVKSYDRKLLEQWISDNCQEEGWILSVNLGSQSSITYAGDETRLNYSVTRYE